MEIGNSQKTGNGKTFLLLLHEKTDPPRTADGRDEEEFERMYRGDKPSYVNNYARAVMGGLG